MKLGLGKSILFMSVSALASAMFARGLVTTFQFDLFKKCLDPTDTEALASYTCRNANDLIQVTIFAVATLIFFAVLVAFWRIPKQSGRGTYMAAGLAAGFFGILVANWQIVLGLQDNFIELSAINRGIPARPTEYGFLLFNRVGDVVAGLILGFAAWVPVAASEHAIDASKRTEPRQKYPSRTTATKTAKVAAAKKKAAPKKKAATKKTAKTTK